VVSFYLYIVAIVTLERPIHQERPPLTLSSPRFHLFCAQTTTGLPVAARLNCCDNTGAKSLAIISVYGIKGRQNRLPSAGVGDIVMAACKKGKPELRKKVHISPSPLSICIYVLCASRRHRVRLKQRSYHGARVRGERLPTLCSSFTQTLQPTVQIPPARTHIHIKTMTSLLRLHSMAALTNPLSLSSILFSSPL